MPSENRNKGGITLHRGSLLVGGLLITIIMLGAGSGLSYRSTVLALTGAHIEATVISNDVFSGAGRSVPACLPTLEFLRPVDHRKMTAAPIRASAAYTFPVGTTVNILALPDGSDFVFDQFSELWLWPSVFVGLGTLTGLVSLLVWDFLRLDAAPKGSPTG